MLKKIAWCLSLMINVSFANVLPVHSQNGLLLNSTGQVIIVRGVNLVIKTGQTPEEAGFNATQAQLLHDHGFNVVRLGVLWSSIEPQPGQFNSTYLNSINNTIHLLAEYGIYTLVDVHEDEYSQDYGDGAPTWATLHKGTKKLDPGFPCNLLGGKFWIRTDINNAYSAFWQDKTINGKGLQEYYLEMLGYLAQSLNNNTILGYDIMNEPYMGREWVNCASSTLPPRFKNGCQNFDNKLTLFNQKAVNALHSVNPNTMVWFEPNLLFGLGVKSYLGTVAAQNIGMTFHDYDASSQFQKPITNALAYQKKEKVPLIEGEYGATLKLNNVEQNLAANNSAMVSSIYWAYFNDPQYKFCNVGSTMPKDPRQQGIVIDMHQPLSGNNINWPLLNLLTAVYPAATSGTPLAFSYSPKPRTFSFRFLPNLNIKAPTIIVVPDILYPTGYKIVVKNVAIASKLPGQLDITPANNQEVSVFIYPK